MEGREREGVASPFGYEELHHAFPGALDGTHDGRAPVDGLRVDLGAALQQQLHQVQLTAVARVVQTRPVEVVPQVDVRPESDTHR